MQHKFENKLLGATSAEQLIINAFGMAASEETLQESRDGENKLGGVNTRIFFFPSESINSGCFLDVIIHNHRQRIRVTSWALLLDYQ